MGLLAHPKHMLIMYGLSSRLCEREYSGCESMPGKKNEGKKSDQGVNPEGIFPPDAEFFGMGVLSHKPVPVAKSEGAAGESARGARHSPGEGRSYSPALLHTRKVELQLPRRLGPAEIKRPKRLHRASLDGRHTPLTPHLLKKAASKFQTALSLRQSIKTQSIPIVALGWLFWASSCSTLRIAARLFLPVGTQRLQPLRPLLRWV